MTAVRVDRILCDNPDCVLYVEELDRECPGEFALVEHVRSLASEDGWTRIGDCDFCPAHGADLGLRLVSGIANSELSHDDFPVVS
jgi:hypothetical protein